MATRADADPVAAALLLGQAWLARGKGRVAAGQLETALRLAPDDPKVPRNVAYLRLFEEDFPAAAAHMARAVRDLPDDAPLRREASLLGELVGRPSGGVDLPANPSGRLRFPSRYAREHHRSGWRPAMEALYPLHHPDGVRFEGFLDEIFAVDHPRAGVRRGPELLAALRRPTWADRFTSEERRVVPIGEPWIGFLHNPHGMPPWFYPDHAPEVVLGKQVWRDSMAACMGLFTLSEQEARWLRGATGKPVSVVHLPTEIPGLVFDFDRFLANPDKRVIQIGWWLRRQTAIDRLPIPPGHPAGVRKLRLVPGFAENSAAQVEGMRAAEFARDGRPDAAVVGEVEARLHVSNAEYDRLLSCNVAFLQLDAANANNAVVECLARATPLLVNRLPAVEEYLGAGYPLYYGDLHDAAAFATDLGRLRAAHEYLRTCDTRSRLAPEAFRRSVEDSEVYRRL